MIQSIKLIVPTERECTYQVMKVVLQLLLAFSFFRCFFTETDAFSVGLSLIQQFIQHFLFLSVQIKVVTKFTKRRITKQVLDWCKSKVKMIDKSEKLKQLVSGSFVEL